METQERIDALGEAWEEFKRVNDRRLAELGANHKLRINCPHCGEKSYNDKEEAN